MLDRLKRALGLDLKETARSMDKRLERLERLAGTEHALKVALFEKDDK